MIEDLNAFFTDFAVPVTYGAQTSLAIFDQPDAEILNGRMVSRQYSIRFPVGTFAGLKHGDNVFVSGLRYYIQEVTTESDGLITLARMQQQ